MLGWTVRPAGERALVPGGREGGREKREGRGGRGPREEEKQPGGGGTLQTPRNRKQKESSIIQGCPLFKHKKLHARFFKEVEIDIDDTQEESEELELD